MSKIEEFKKFALKHPELSDYIKNNNSSWQRLFELYDIYGEKEEVWEKYLNSSNQSNNFSIKGIINSLKNINLESLEENITSIQKAASFIEEFTKPGESKEKKKATKEENIERFYND